MRPTFGEKSGLSLWDFNMSVFELSQIDPASFGMGKLTGMDDLLCRQTIGDMREVRDALMQPVSSANGGYEIGNQSVPGVLSGKDPGGLPI